MSRLRSIRRKMDKEAYNEAIELAKAVTRCMNASSRMRHRKSNNNQVFAQNLVLTRRKNENSKI